MKRNSFEKKDGAVNRTKDTFEKYNFKNTFVNKYFNTCTREIIRIKICSTQKSELKINYGNYKHHSQRYLQQSS